MGLDIVALDILSIRHCGIRHCGMFPNKQHGYDNAELCIIIIMKMTIFLGQGVQALC